MAKYSLPDLDYDYNALSPLYDAEMLELHHSAHHAGYVNGANKTLEKLKEVRAEKAYDHINQLQKNLAFNVSGHVMHSIFWTNMSPDGGGDPSDKLAEQIERDFGSVDQLREQMTHAGKSLQGSGWVSLSWEPMAESLIVEQVYDHQGNTGSATTPVLVIDCWEHAFYLQYRNKKAKWLENFWLLVNWDDVHERFKNSSQHTLT
ncbi:MAG: superoxide dismutase [Gammaproteobacteria bacterium]|nr:superoxide dismutase [Gammaproteobacteria bacterium]